MPSFLERLARSGRKNPVTKYGGRTLRDLGAVARQTPSGVIHTFASIGKDAAQSVRTDPLFHGGNIRGPLLGGKYKPIRMPRTEKLVGESLHSMKQDLRHPLRHPGYTLLDLLAFAAPVAKAVEVGAATGRTGSLTRALAESKAPKTRTIRHKPKTQAEKDAFNKALGFDKPLTRDVKREPLPPRAKRIEASYQEVKKMKMGSRAKYEKWEQIAKDHKINRRNLKNFIEKQKPTNEEVKKWIFDPREQTEKKVITKKRTVGAEISRQIPASRVASTRYAQKGLDALVGKSHRLSRRRMERAIMREKDLIDRVQNRSNSKGFLRSLGDLKNKETWKEGRHLIRETNAGVRALRLYRPGYILPNLAGAIGTNLIQQGGRLPKNMMIERRLRRNHPETAKALDRALGENSAQSVEHLGENTDVVGPVQTVAHGLGTSLGKVTDRRARARSFIDEARRHGVHEEDIPGLIKEVMEIEGGNSAAVRKFARIADTAEKDAIRFTRTKAFPGRGEGVIRKADRELAKRVFLYKWITGSGQYSARMLSQHPTLSMALGQSGRNSPDISDALKQYPDFMASYLPAGVRGKLPKVSNLQAASLFDMPGEVAQTASRAWSDPVQLLERLNPVQAALLIGLVGEDPFTHRTIKGRTKANPDAMKSLKFGIDTQLRGNPYFKLGRLGESKSKRDRRLFPLTPEDIFLQFILGGWYPEPVNSKVAKRMARSDEKRRNQGKKRPSAPTNRYG